MSKSKSIETLKMSPSQVAQAIRAMVPTKRAMFCWGPPGVSKSQTAQQVATELGMAFIDLRLSQMDPSDLRGIPFPTKIGGVEGVRWSTPFVLPKNLDLELIADIEDADETTIHFGNPIGTNGIYYVQEPEITVKAIGAGKVAKIISSTPDKFVVALFAVDDKGVPTDVMTTGKVRATITGTCKAMLALEEFNSAAQSVQAAAYQLILDRRLGEYIVPDDVFILGMGNRDTDRGVTFKMPTPVMNRFVHVEMTVSFDDWQRWALLTMQHPDVVGYLSAFKQKLFQFEAGTASRGFATPRSWEFVSDILRANDDLPETIMINLVAGAVGDGDAVQFVAHRTSAKDLPRVEDILSGKVLKMPNGRPDVSLCYALATTLCYEMKERAEKVRGEAGDNWRKSKAYDQWIVEADNFFKFITDNFQPEICIMSAKAAIQLHKLPIDTQRNKNFVTFVERYKDFIMN